MTNGQRNCRCPTCNGKKLQPQTTARRHELTWGFHPRFAYYDDEEILDLEETAVIYESDEESQSDHPLDQVASDVLVAEFCQELVDLISRNVVKQTGACAMNKLYMAKFGHLVFPRKCTSVSLPTNMHSIKVKAGQENSKTTMPIICPRNDHIVYAPDCAPAVCPCGEPLFDADGRPFRTMLCFDVLDRITRIWAIPRLAEALHYVTTRETGDGDAWDGSVLCDTPMEERLNSVHVALTADATELADQVSYTPVVLRWLQLPPWLRHLFAGILLWAVFPSSVKNYKALYTYLLKMVAHALPGGTGFHVWDSWSQKQRLLHLRLGFNCDDSRGTLHRDSMFYIHVLHDSAKTHIISPKRTIYR
jgi:hypothetical protein